MLACFVIDNHVDASDSEDIDEWEQRSMSEDEKDDNEYCAT